MNTDPAARPGAPAPRVPGSVAELAAIRAWTVGATAKGAWTTAECAIEVGARRWVIGLTPTAGGAVALILWRDDVVVTHLRGTEAEMCRRAFGWATDLLAGKVPFAASGPSA